MIDLAMVCWFAWTLGVGGFVCWQLWSDVSSRHVRCGAGADRP